MLLHEECDRLFSELDQAYRSGNARHAATLATIDAVISPVDLSDIVGRDTIWA